MPSTAKPRRETRSTRAKSQGQSSSAPPPGPKRPSKRRRREWDLTQEEMDLDPDADNNISDPNYLPTPSATQQPPLPTASATQQPTLPTTTSHRITDDIKLSDITLKNYQAAKKSWPVGRIQAQLARQRSSNHQLSAAVIAEGQAVLQDLDHTIHMIAMVAGVDISKLKRALGLMGGTHGENPWHRWLSFALDANKVAMPLRGDPNSSDILTCRNQANSITYQALTDDEYAVFTSKVFYALGGYPDYGAITITEDSNAFGDSSILIPEVPKLKEEEELLYRPIYEKLVDSKKVERDRKLNTPSASSQKQEKQSLQCMKKIAQELARYHHLVGLDYYVIACSNSSSGEGWCREYTSRDEISTWVETKAHLQHVFPLYCQNATTIDEVNSVAATSKPSVTHKASNNKSDTDKKTLGDMLNRLLGVY
ncbi:uncharacterized protein MELLADRAFT_86089 [Melampsora larici-populina 98AG31]|uniref:Uncharacterized protein n=1 Tax=Melampsora larici-populina (strain 98AG31 / pathotype 3-4-7) TaxID=747676 RepID=F4SDH5_MELLP|nr:uncharacterized protein MELLADRAFT_86089 [Melampsora larici-populina 98AG31]EGF97301.1 hypothetical protein MELLADRAFT_86089 [Melampsora larici-populina 98AG31]